jgi:thiamine kinase-like enzyme
MLPDEVERLAARHVPGEGKIDIHRLSVGLVNETYRVLRAGTTYALRAAGSGPHSLGLDRTWEARVLECAAPCGLAPVVEYCDPHRGILISRWVEGRSWNPAEVRESSSIARVAELARRIHALPIPVPARLMSPAQWIDYYSAAASGDILGDSATAVLRTAASRRLAALAALPAVDPVVCHSDLHTLNLVDRGLSLVLLDWEYAHAADPLWDLAGWSANNDFDDEIRQALFASYAGRPPTPVENLRLQLLGWLYDYVCLLWCDLYSTLHAAQGTMAPRVQKLNARLIATASSRAD